MVMCVGKLDEVEALYRSMLEARRGHLGNSHWRTKSSVHALAKCLEQQGKQPISAVCATVRVVTLL